MAITISIDGADNVGKTTQIELLPRHWAIERLDSLHQYDQRLGDLVKTSKLKQWWWTCDDQEFVLVIFEALESRRKSIKLGHGVQIVVCDRGARMFEAVAAATIAIKNGYDGPAKGRLKLQTILKQHDIQPVYEDVSVLMKHHKDLDKAIEVGLSREIDPVDERYKCYQLLLHQEIDYQEKLGQYHHVQIEGEGESQLFIQDRLRRTLATYTLPHIFMPVLSTLRTVYAIGGLSESGKSTVAAELVAFHGPLSARLKIGYFLDAAGEKLRKDVYTLSEKEQALLLIQEIQIYAQAHHWLRYITIESVHRFQSLRWMKTWLDTTMQIIYIDAGEETRLTRTQISREEFHKKDALKLSRGAERVREIADLILDNNANVTLTVAALRSFAQRNLDGQTS